MEHACYIELFGGLTVRLRRRIITRFRTHNTGGLLAYLAYHRDRVHSREVLADLFWPEAASPQAARTSLSVSLSSLRSQLEPPGVPAGSVLSADKSHVGVTAAVTTDVAAFEHLLKRAEHAGGDTERAAFLAQATRIYRSELLPGYYDDWVSVQKEYLAGRFLEAVGDLSRYFEREGSLDRALTYAQQALSADPFDEEAGAALVRLVGGWKAAAGANEPALAGAVGAAAATAAQRLPAGAGRRDLRGAPPSAEPSRHGAHTLVQSVFQQAAPAVPGGGATTGRRGRRRIEAGGGGGLPPVTPGGGHWPGGSDTPPAALLAPRPEPRTSARPAPSPPAPAPLPLPTPLTRLFGREEERQRLGSFLRSSSVRLLTLTGPGGIGKSRLALALADDLRDGAAPAGTTGGDFAPGDRRVYYVGLCEQGDAQDLLPAVEEAVGLAPEPASAGKPVAVLARVAEVLEQGASVLVLDGADLFVTQITPFLTNLLRQTSRVTCVVTSRQRLYVPGEQVYAVPPLPAPEEAAEDGEPASDGAVAELLERNPAVALFVDRAQLTRPDFQLTRRNAAAVARLVSCLDGIPLAIELAAARSQVLSPQQMLAQVERRFEFLRQSRGGDGDRHRSLREAMAWSFRLLPRELQQALCQLSVFRGGWTEESAAEVTGRDFLLDDLMQLADASFIQSAESDDVMRFSMLETLREFAAEQAKGDPEFAAARESAALRHLRHFGRLGAEAKAHLVGQRQAEWVENLQRELGNLRAALHWALTSGEPEAARGGVSLAADVVNFWAVRGYWTEGRRWLEGLQSRFAALCAPDAAVEAPAWNARGILAYYQGDFPAARPCFHTLLALHGILNDPAAKAKALNNLAIIDSEMGDLDAAREKYQEALDIWRRLGDNGRVAKVLANLGADATRRGELDLALRLHQESLSLQRGVPRSEAVSHINLGQVYLVREEMAEARRHFCNGLRLFRGLGDEPSSLLSLLNVGMAVDGQSGDLSKAERLIGSALAACERQSIRLSGWWQEDLTRYEGRTAGRLNPEQRRALREEGAALSIDAAVALALEDALGNLVDAARR